MDTAKLYLFMFGIGIVVGWFVGMFVGAGLEWYFPPNEQDHVGLAAAISGAITGAVAVLVLIVFGRACPAVGVASVA